MLNKILSNLWQGDREAALTLVDKGVDYVVYIGQELPYKLGFRSKVPVVHIPIRDGVDDPKRWKLLYVILNNLKESKVLVSCRAGMSRSPMVILYYLLESRCFKEYDEAYNFVKEKVPIFQPERNMEKMVKKMLKEGREKMEVDLKTKICFECKTTVKNKEATLCPKCGAKLHPLYDPATDNYTPEG